MAINNFHKHTYWSNILISDSVCSMEEYAIKTVEYGGKILSSLEHGWQGNYYETYELAKKYNLKFIFGVEAYWVKDRRDTDKTNNHICIFARNEKGRRAINKALSEANKTGYYYRPRLDYELILNLPAQDVFVTTACLAFYGYGQESFDFIIKLKEHFGENLMLEIQNHYSESQIKINKVLKDFSKQYNIPLIVGLDSHYVDATDKNKRLLYLEGKGIEYKDGEENSWYMDYPTDEIIVERFLKQGVFSEQEIRQAMDNTNIFLEFEDISFNSDSKMITIYPNWSQEEKDNYYKQIIRENLKKYAIENNISPQELKSVYIDGINSEVSTVIDTKMTDYFLLDYELAKKGKENGGIITTTGRGSAGSHFTNTLFGLSKMDRFKAPIKLYPERFMSKTRILETKSMPDIDLNLGNPEVFAETQKELLGENHSYPMIAFGLLKTKSAFKMYARAQNMDFQLANEIVKQIDEYEKALKYADDDEKDQIDIAEYVSAEYLSYIELSKQYQKIVDNKSPHPCGYMLYCGEIDEEIGLILCKSESTQKETLCTVIDGKTADKYGFIKNDLLKVDVVMLNNALYESIGQTIPSTNKLTELVESDGGKTWELYKNGITCAINQVEKEGTRRKVQKYAPKNVAELACFIAAIRPSFKNLYSKFERREHFEYGIKSLDTILQTDQVKDSWILMQEQLMAVLAYAGIPMDRTYDIIKSISKKKIEKVLKYKEQFLDGFANKLIENKECENSKAKELAQNVWDIVESFCGYGFNACVSGSTVLMKKSTEKDYGLTVEEMYKIKHDKSYAERKNRLDLFEKYNRHNKFCYGKAFSMDSNMRIVKNKIIDIYYSGRRLTYKITTQSGKEIICTDNHKFPTTCGKKRTDELEIGDYLFSINPEDGQKHIDSDAIISIVPIKFEDVYDIEMMAPNHNFLISNGLVTSNSHALAYAYDSLYSAYFKAHYPLKFYEVALNYYSENSKKEKVSELCQEAQSAYNFVIANPVFGRNNSKFVIQDDSTINKDISSIKGFNKTIGENLYAFSKELGAFEKLDFPTLLPQLYSRKILNSKQLDILITLDYFSIYGGSEKLKKYISYYEDFGTRSQIKKNGNYSVPIERLKQYCGKETAAQYSQLDSTKLLKDLWAETPNKDVPLKEKLKYQLEYLGYITYTNSRLSDYYYVTEVEQKQKYYLIYVYNLGSGESQRVKCKNLKQFEINPLGKDNIFQLLRAREDYKWKFNTAINKCERTDEKEIILEEWIIK